MPRAPRSVVIGTRTSSDTKARFAALAARRGLTESAFLAQLVEHVIASNSPSDAAEVPPFASDAGRANDRLTLRLRPGDRALADARAASRRMKTASYVTMLVRSHVRGTPVMPPKELEELRCVAGLLASFHRQFRSLGANAVASSNAQSDGQAPWADVGRVIEGVGDAVASVVRANLISWEAGRA